MEDLFYQLVRKLEEKGETDHQSVFVDGTKLESRAGRYTFVWRGSVEKHLAKVKGRVRQETGLSDPEKLREYLETEAGHIDFVHGSGRRKSAEQKRWEGLYELLERWETYERQLAIMVE